MPNDLYTIKHYFIGQVINKKSVGDAYSSTPENKDNLFSIDVVSYEDSGKVTHPNVQPANSNIKQIPVTGESVLVFQSINQQSKPNETAPQLYYIGPLNINSRIDNNIIPSIEKDQELDEHFYLNAKTSPLQPYRGDLLLEGRWGNSIRFGSTINSGDYDIPTPWNGSKTGDPILILSNTTKRESQKKFIIESLKDDKSASILLSSTQYFQDLNLNKSLGKYKSETSYQQSQLIAQANRIVLSSGTDITLIDSNKAVVLNSPIVRLGNDEASIPMVHGDELAIILKQMLDLMSFGFTGLAGFPVFHNRISKIQQLKTKVNNIKSKKYFITK